MSYTVEWPDAECHEVLPNLFMGGHAWAEDGQARDGRHSTVSEDKTWSYVLSAYVDTEHEQSWPRCDTRFILFADTESGLDDDTWERIRSAVQEVAIRWENGQKVLIRCQAGYNRSGMLTALVLMNLGFTAERAIRVIRKRRGDDCLVNPEFEKYVRDREPDYLIEGNLPYTEMYAKDVAPEWLDLIR